MSGEMCLGTATLNIVFDNPDTVIEAVSAAVGGEVT